MSYRRLVRSAKVCLTWAVVASLGLSPAGACHVWSSVCGGCGVASYVSAVHVESACEYSGNMIMSSSAMCDLPCGVVTDEVSATDGNCGGSCEVTAHPCVDCGATSCAGCGDGASGCVGESTVVEGSAVPMETPSVAPAPSDVRPILPSEPATTAPSATDEPSRSTKPMPVDDMNKSDVPSTAPMDDIEPSEPMADPPATDSGDDLFGDTPTTEPAPMPETPAETETPATEPAAGDDLGDLFDTEPANPAADAAPEAEPAAADAAGDDLGDLFDTEPAAPADTDAAPAEPAETKPESSDNLDDLFPTSGSNESGLNKSNEATEKQDEASDDPLKDLFGARPENVPAELVKVAPVSKRPVQPESRTWVDNTGKFETVGELVLVADSYVRLLKNNGRHCTVPMRRLSPADRQYVETMREQWDGTPLIQVATSGAANR